MTEDLPDWTRQVRLIGTDADGNLVAIAVDADGNAIAQIYGVYDTTLKPLLTDWLGRLLIVPYDEKDIWGRSIFVGFGELAVRLGSPRSFDKGGETLFCISFEHGFTWLQAVDSSPEEVVSLSVASSRTGAYSAKFAFDDADAMPCALTGAYPYPALTRFGLEVSFTAHADVSYYQLTQTVETGGDRYWGSVRYTPATTTLAYLDDANAFQTISTDPNLFEDDHFFNNLKLVVDMTDQKYERVQLNNWAYDLSAYGMYYTGGYEENRVAVTFSVYGVATKTFDVYVDDFIVTHNEPENA